MSERTKHLIGFALSIAIGALGAWQADPQLAAMFGVSWLLAALSVIQKATQGWFGGSGKGGPGAGLTLLIAGAFGLASCTGCSHVPGPIVDYGQCLSGEMQAEVPQIIPTVVTDLTSSNYVALLTDLGKRVGYAVVDCAVREVLAQSHADRDANPDDQLASVRIIHGNLWLSR